MMQTVLGKISAVTFGLVGYQDACLGIRFTFEGDWGGVCYDKSAWDANCIKHSEHHKWTEADRSKQYDEIMRYISDILHAAKVKSVAELKGVPVEITFTRDHSIDTWRVLEEVI